MTGTLKQATGAMALRTFPGRRRLRSPEMKASIPPLTGPNARDKPHFACDCRP